MLNRKYVVCRDDIYVGEVITPIEIFRYEGSSNLCRIKPGQLRPGFYTNWRSMIFTLNENKLSNDLLFNSPNYPILNVTSDDICLNLDDYSIVINDCYNIAPLLEYFGYDKDLKYKDILEIRKIFFTGRFGRDNCKLFGMKEIIPSGFRAYVGGVNVTDHNIRYELYKKSLNIYSDRYFERDSVGVLAKEIMDVLDDRGRPKNCLAKDSFKPQKNEKYVKKLSLF